MSGVTRRLNRFADKVERALIRSQTVDPDAAPRWTPLADNPPQQQAYATTADHTFFGGLAGSGKSSLLIGMALTRQRKSLILRKQATQLPEIKEYLRECMRPGDKFAQVGHGARVTTFDGRKIELSGCDTIAVAQKYKGRAHDYKGYDEASDFPESVFRFINIWNRTTFPGQVCRVVAASNPPTTAEGDWVISYWGPWLDPRYGQKLENGQLGWFIRDPEKNRDILVGGPEPVKVGDKFYKPLSRTFIPGVMVTPLEDAGYRASLEMLPEELRDVYLKGDFGAAKKDHEFQLIRSDWVKMAMLRGEKQAWRRTNGMYGFPTPPFAPLTSLGVDPAGGGVDETSIAPAYGRDIGPLWSYRGKETADGMLLYTKVYAATEQNPEAPIRIDTTGGYGLECANIISRADPQTRVVDPISFGSATAFRDRSGLMTFQDIRSAMWWNLREMLDPNGKADHEQVTLPDCPRLFADLCAPRWRHLSGNVIAVEPKMSRQGVSVQGVSQWGIKDRLGRSPDRGDAVALALWPGERPLPIVGFAYSTKKK